MAKPLHQKQNPFLVPVFHLWFCTAVYGEPQTGRAHLQTVSAAWYTCLLSFFQGQRPSSDPSQLDSEISPLHLGGSSGQNEVALLSVPGFPCDQYSVGRGSHICLSPWKKHWPPSSQGFCCFHSDGHESCSLAIKRTLKGQACWRLGWTGFPDSEHLSVTSILLDLPNTGRTSTSVTALEFSGTARSVEVRRRWGCRELMQMEHRMQHKCG